MRGLLLIFCCAFAAGIDSADAFELTGEPEIIDGDTLQLDGTTIRLFGIDAAESGQRCVNAEGKFVRPGNDAELRLLNLSIGGIRCKGKVHDDFGRLIAWCTSAHGTEINRTLVREGLAWAFVKYSRDYVTDEAVARGAKLGVWRLACEPPWIFREKRWNVAIQKAPKGCPIKGNISGNERIYHTPWSRHYARTKVSLEKGEQWFCSEKEATAAGFRPPKR